MKYARGVGLSQRYSACDTTRKFIRCMMALPLLPGENIRQKFEDLSLEIKEDNAELKKLAAYMHRQWIYSTVHTLSSISVHGLSTRTNNDTEGYHRRLNKRVGECHVNVYKLINILYEEASDVKITKALVSLNKMNKQKKIKYVINNLRLLNLFESYNDNNISAYNLMLSGSYLINPSNNIMNVLDIE